MAEMDPELRERREMTFDLLVIKGFPYRKVVEQVSSEYDTSQTCIETDIYRMKNWLPKLADSDATRKDGVMRLRELRQSRQRMQRMAMEAQREGDRYQEMAIRDRITKNIKLDLEMSQSLGIAERAPDKSEVAMSVSDGDKSGSYEIVSAQDTTIEGAAPADPAELTAPDENTE